MPSMIAIVHSIYSKSVHAPAAHAGLMDNESERYCILNNSKFGFDVLTMTMTMTVNNIEI